MPRLPPGPAKSEFLEVVPVHQNFFKLSKLFQIAAKFARPTTTQNPAQTLTCCLLTDSHCGFQFSQPQNIDDINTELRGLFGGNK